MDSSFFLRLLILGIVHLLLLWDVLQGGFCGFLPPYALDFLGMVSLPYPFAKVLQTAANGAHSA